MKPQQGVNGSLTAGGALRAIGGMWERWLRRHPGWRAHGADVVALIGIVGFAILASLPTFQFKQIVGHDSFAYLPRIIEFHEGLKEGQWFPRWAPDAGSGYGQPVFNFVPPLVYYLSNGFHGLSFDFLASMNLACFLLMVLSGITMYLLAREFFGPWAGFVAGVAYIFAPYHLVCLYVRYALTDFSGFPFIPLALWAIHRYIRASSQTMLVVGASAVALLVLSSNSIALMAMPLLAAWVLLEAWSARDLKALGKGSLLVLGGLGLSAFYSLPRVLEQHMVSTARLLSGYFYYGDHFVYLRQFIISPWGYGLSKAGTGDGMSFEIGIVYLLSTAACLWFGKYAPKSTRQYLWFFLGVLAVSVFLSTAGSVLLWQKLPLLAYLSFPWRFLTIAAMVTSLLCGFPLWAARGRPRLQAALFVALLVGIVFVGLPRCRARAYADWTDATFSPDRIAQESMQFGSEEEYEPIWVQERPANPASEKLQALTGGIDILEQSIRPTRYDFLLEAGERSLLRVNTFYFPGWEVWIDGQPSQVDYHNKGGLITFEVEEGRHRIQVLFADTPVRTWGRSISVVSFVLLLATWIIAAAVKCASGRHTQKAV